MRLILPLALLPLTANADVQVVTDIAPIHSLVAQVMEGVGVPDVLVNAGASPHDFQFTFAQADAVQNADVVIWAGAGLTPWLEEALVTLAPDAEKVSLLETEDWPKLEMRELTQFGEDDHDHDHAEHDHEGDHAVDPHAWLDPIVAVFWLGQIRDTLMQADPENAEIYHANAEAAGEDILQMAIEIDVILEGIPTAPYLVPHDAYQYFETRFGHPVRAAISQGDATTPTPDQIAALRDIVAETGVVCVLSDPQARAEWGDLVREGADVRTAMADPIGGAFETGPQHYRQTMMALTTAFADCIGG